MKHNYLKMMETWATGLWLSIAATVILLGNVLTSAAVVGWAWAAAATA